MEIDGLETMRLGEELVLQFFYLIVDSLIEIVTGNERHWMCPVEIIPLVLNCYLLSLEKNIVYWR